MVGPSPTMTVLLLLGARGLPERADQQLHIAACLFDGSRHGHVAACGGMEGAQLLAEGFLVTGAMLDRLQSMTTAAALHREAGGLVAQIRRRERQLNDSVGAVDRDPLGI